MTNYQRNKYIALYEANKFVRLFPNYQTCNATATTQYKAVFYKQAKKYGLIRTFKTMGLI